MGLVDEPDRTVFLPLTGRCDCGRCCAGIVASPLPERRQVSERVIRREVTEYRIVEGVCVCGQAHRSAFPPGIEAPVQYGPGVYALAVHLTQYQLPPYQRTAELFDELAGIAISPATVHAAVRSAATRVQPEVAAIGQALVRAAVAHADETGVREESTPAVFSDRLRLEQKVHLALGQRDEIDRVGGAVESQHVGEGDLPCLDRIEQRVRLVDPQSGDAHRVGQKKQPRQVGPMPQDGGEGRVGPDGAAPGDPGRDLPQEGIDRRAVHAGWRLRLEGFDLFLLAQRLGSELEGQHARLGRVQTGQAHQGELLQPRIAQVGKDLPGAWQDDDAAVPRRDLVSRTIGQSSPDLADHTPTCVVVEGEEQLPQIFRVPEIHVGEIGDGLLVTTHGSPLDSEGRARTAAHPSVSPPRTSRRGPPRFEPLPRG
jgi:transposase